MRGHQRIDEQVPAGRSEQPVIKTPTGIKGFDDISGGGLPDDRITTVFGGPGAGKTVFALQTVVNRLITRGEAAIVVAFEESVASIEKNMASFDWKIDEPSRSKLVFVNARIPSDAVIGGAFDLNALLAGLTALKEETDARTIVFDGLDMLLTGLDSEILERQELSRLNEWVQLSKVSAIITAKSFGISGRDQLRSDFMQYLTDCAILLSSSFTETTSSRSLRIKKFRGSGFAANPAPLVIGRSGISVLAFRGTRGEYPVFIDRVSSGIPRLDALLGGGYTRGSSILISGSPGTSKTSLSASFAAAACMRGEKALFISFDESGSQIVSNMKSIGLDFAAYLKNGYLAMASLLSNGRSPEEHFMTIRDLLEQHAPQCLVIDPLSALLKAEYPFTEMISESLVDLAKTRGITVVCTSLLGNVSGEIELSASHISTIADTWIHVSYVAEAGERNRALTIIKSRGTSHSNQVRELRLSHEGVHLEDVYIAEGNVLMGSARAQKEAEVLRLQALARLDHEQARRQLDQDMTEIEARSQSVALELMAKQRQLRLSEHLERHRVEQETSTALARLTMRTSHDNAIDASSPTEDL